jgi:hypothetical protein
VKKRSDIQTVRVEILSPSAESPTPKGAELLRKLVEKQVAMTLASRDDFVFQPFFQAQKVADEIKRCQNVGEQRKWSIFYERWGCLICGQRAACHVSCGMCQNCHARTDKRLRTIVKNYKPESEGPADYGFIDDAEIARQAFAGPLKALPPAKIRKSARPR